MNGLSMLLVVLTCPVPYSLATFTNIPRACGEPSLPNWSAISCLSNPACRYSLPVSPRSDGSPTLIWNLSVNYHMLLRLSDCLKDCRYTYSGHAFLFPPLCSLNGIYFSLECCGVEPNAVTILLSWFPSIHPSTSAFIGPGLVYVPDQSPFIWI